MVFFTSFFHAVSGAAKKVGNALGVAVQKIGETFHADAIEMVGINLRCACDFGENSWSTHSSTEQTVDTHKELGRIISSITPQAEEAEEKLIQICVEQLGEILDSFLTISKNIAPASGLLRMEENNEADIRATLSGQVMKYIQPRLSLDDNECKRILAIQDSSERERQAAEFKEKVLKSAEEQFKQQCSNVKRDYCERMLKLSENLLSGAKREYEDQKILLEQILQENKDENAIDLERAHALLLQEKLVLLGALALEQKG